MQQPPGGYGPPPAWGPPVQIAPPPRKGPSVTVIVAIALVAVVVFGGAGCIACFFVVQTMAKERDEQEAQQRRLEAELSAVAPTPPPQAPAPPPPTWITSERPAVKFIQPPGWAKNLKGEWGVFTSPSGSAVYAFTTFHSPGESTARLAKAAWVLGVEDIKWGSPVWSQVGRDHYRAHMGEGTCNFHGPGGYVWYATVDSGTSDQILLIYAVNARGTKADKDAVLASIASLTHR